MSRRPGNLFLPASVERTAKGPLDAKVRVRTLAELLDLDSWQVTDPGTQNLIDVYYAGMNVTVYGDPTPNNNGLYWLKGNDVTLLENWQKVGTGEGGSTIKGTWQPTVTVTPALAKMQKADALFIEMADDLIDEVVFTDNSISASENGEGGMAIASTSFDISGSTENRFVVYVKYEGTETPDYIYYGFYSGLGTVLNDMPMIFSPMVAYVSEHGGLEAGGEEPLYADWNPHADSVAHVIDFDREVVEVWTSRNNGTKEFEQTFEDIKQSIYDNFEATVTIDKGLVTFAALNTYFTIEDGESYRLAKSGKMSAAKTFDVSPSAVDVFASTQIVDLTPPTDAANNAFILDVANPVHIPELGKELENGDIVFFDENKTPIRYIPKEFAEGSDNADTKTFTPWQPEVVEGAGIDLPNVIDLFESSDPITLTGSTLRMERTGFPLAEDALLINGLKSDSINFGDITSLYYKVKSSLDVDAVRSPFYVGFSNSAFDSWAVVYAGISGGLLSIDSIGEVLDGVDNTEFNPPIEVLVTDDSEYCLSYDKALNKVTFFVDGVEIASHTFATDFGFDVVTGSVYVTAGDYQGDPSTLTLWSETEFLSDPTHLIAGLEPLIIDAGGSAIDETKYPENREGKGYEIIGLVQPVQWNELDREVKNGDFIVFDNDGVPKEIGGGGEADLSEYTKRTADETITGDWDFRGAMKVGDYTYNTIYGPYPVEKIITYNHPSLSSPMNIAYGINTGYSFSSMAVAFNINDLGLGEYVVTELFTEEGSIAGGYTNVYSTTSKENDGTVEKDMRIEAYAEGGALTSIGAVSRSDGDAYLNFVTGTEPVRGMYATNILTESSGITIKEALDSKVDKVEGKGLTTNDFTTPLLDKLTSLEGSHWRGTFPTLVALQTAVTDAVAGDYADVDGGVGSDVVRYIWDATDNDWVPQESATSLTASQVKQLYESNDDTNAFTDDDKSKLSGLGTTATKNVGTSDGQVPEFVSSGEGLGGFGYGRVGTPAGRYADVNDVPKRTGSYLLTDGHPNSTNNKAPLVGFYDTAILRISRESINDFVDLYLPYHQYSNGMVIAPHTSGGYAPQRIVSDSINLRTGTGNSTIYPMSQKAVTDALATKADKVQEKVILTASRALTQADIGKVLLVSADGITITLPTGIPNFTVDIVKMDEDFTTLAQTSSTDKFREDVSAVTIVKDVTIFSTGIVGKEYVAIGAYEV